MTIRSYVVILSMLYALPVVAAAQRTTASIQDILSSYTPAEKPVDPEQQEPEEETEPQKRVLFDKDWFQSRLFWWGMYGSLECVAGGPHVANGAYVRAVILEDWKELGLPAQDVTERKAFERSALFHKKPVAAMLFLLSQQVAADIGFLVTRDFIDGQLDMEITEEFEPSIEALYSSLFAHLAVQQHLMSRQAFAAYVATDATFLVTKKLFERVTGKKFACPKLAIPSMLRSCGLTEQNIQAVAIAGTKLGMRIALNKALEVNDTQRALLSVV